MLKTFCNFIMTIRIYFIFIVNRNLLLTLNSCKNANYISTETRKTNFFFLLVKSSLTYKFRACQEMVS